MADNHSRLAVVMEAIAIGYCKDCSHRVAGDCTNEKITENVFCTDDQLVCPDSEYGKIIVGDYFGCVHFEE